MRVTENRLLHIATRGLNSAKSSFSKSSEALSSGVSVNRPSDDPSAWAEGMRAAARRTLNGAKASTVEQAAERTREVDTHVRNVSDLLGDVQELTVQMANGIFNADDRVRGANEIRVLRDQILSSLNAADVNGEYLFGGSQSDSAPFDAAGAYVGDGDVRAVDAGGGLRVGTSVTGNQFVLSDGTSIPDMLESVAVAMETNDQAALSGRVDSVKEAVTATSLVAVDVGIRMEALDRSVGAMKDFEIHLENVLNNRVGADPIEAAMSLTRSQGAIDGARAVIEQVVSVLRAG